MKSIFLCLFAITFSTSIIYAQCTGTPTTKILIIGDSWANLSWGADSYNENMNNYGLSDYDTYSTAQFSVNGTEASNYFDDAARVQALEDYINNNPDLEFVHFSLGGNDALGNWNKNMSQQEVDSLMAVIFGDIKAGIDIIHSFNPNLKIVMAGYDYPNFDETVGTLAAPLQPFHPYFPLWDGMGQPNAEEINVLLSEATERFIDSSWAWPNVYFINNLGLMQWYYGQTTPLTVAPYGTYPQFDAPVPGGYIDYPTPLEALNGGGLDAFHLSDQGYEYFVGRHFSEFYWWQIRKPHQTIYSNDSTLNGWVSLSDSNSNWLQTGNENGDTVKTILHFDTSPMDDIETLDAASIFIQRDSLYGSNLIVEDLSLEIASGYFGASMDLQLDDFAAAADDSSSACTYGTIDTSGTWMRIDIPSSMLQYIDSDGTTQFRLTYTTVTDSNRFVTFMNESDKIFIDLKYTSNPFASVEKPTQNSIKIYPNPTSDFLHIQSDLSFEHASVFSINGELVSKQIIDNNLVDVKDLPAGIYFVRLQSNGHIFTEKFIKH